MESFEIRVNDKYGPKDKDKITEVEDRWPVTHRWVPHHPDYVNEWVEFVLKKGLKESGIEHKAGEEEIHQKILANAHPVIKDLRKHILNNSMVYMYLSEALKESKTGKTVGEFLIILNTLLTMSPEYKEDFHEIVCNPVALAICSFVATPSGRRLFQYIEMAEALKNYLHVYSQFLISPQSWEQVKDGWLSENGKKLMKFDDYIIPKDGFKSWNHFFTRRIKPSARPIANKKDDKIIICPCDGILFDIKRNVQEYSEFWVKQQPYSLRTIFNNNEKMIEKFIGGDIVQFFLDPHNYHRWHAPTGGQITYVEDVDGLYYSVLGWKGSGNFPEWPGSLPYMSMVNRRSIICIENSYVGSVAFIPVGMLDVSSVITKVNPFYKVEKGDELGYFQFGGSTILLIFQKGVINEYCVFRSDESEDAPSVKFGEKLALVS